MNPSLSQLLRCPFCTGRFETTIALADQISANREYDVLSCYCGRYPVVAGIPILKKNKATEKVIALIEAGQHCEALLTVLSRRRFPISIRLIPSLLPYKATSFLEGLLEQRKLKKWKEQAIVMLMDQSRQATARDLIYFLIQHGRDYFFFRFGQPRHLIALSLVSIINQPMKAVLGACPTLASTHLCAGSDSCISHTAS